MEAARHHEVHRRARRQSSGGLASIEDPIGTVYGPSKIGISEFPNEGLYRGLTEFAQAIGLNHERRMNAGGEGVLGHVKKAPRRGE